MYSGRLQKGILLFAAGQLLFLASAISLTVVTPAASYVVFLVAINLAYSIFCIVDAVVAARRGKEHYQPARYNRWYAYVTFIVLAGLVEVYLLPELVSENYVQVYTMPTGSMEPTILIGDRVLVNRRIYGAVEPHRGDVAIFKYPEDPEVPYVKRLVGLPGERLEMKNRTVYINDEPIDEDYTKYINPGSMEEHYGPVYIPKKGDVIEFTGNAVKVNDSIVNEYVVPSYPERTASGKEPYVVAQNQYFAIGDNRDNSKDSRYWGTVPQDYLLGKAIYIYWSFETPRGAYLRSSLVDRLKQAFGLVLHFGGRTRWDRIFMPVE